MPVITDPNTSVINGGLNQRIFSVYDAGKPEYVNQLVARFGLQFVPFYQKLRWMGREEAVSGNGEWFAYEENRFHRELRVLAPVADPGVGNDTTFQLDPTYISAGGDFYGRVGDIVVIQGTGVNARIMSIAGVAPNIFITLKPVSATSNIGALAAGQYLGIANGAFADGTGQPDGATQGWTKVIFRPQIYKETVHMEGTEVTKQMWFDGEKVFDANGNVVPFGIVSYNTANAQKRLNLKIDGSFLVGELNTNPTLTEVTPRGETNTILTTEGLIPKITQRGSTFNIAGGALAMSDFQDVGLYMRGQGATSNVVYAPVGARRRNEVDDLMKAFIQGNGDTFTEKAKIMLGRNKNDRYMHCGFSEIYYGGYSFIMDTVDVWSDPTTFALPGYNYEWQGLFIPLAEMKMPTGELSPNICVKYVEKNGYNRRFELWRDGAAGGDTSQYRGDVDEAVYYMRSHMGFQALACNQMIHLDE